MLKLLLSPGLRPVENVVLTTKGLQDRNIHILDGTTVENKDKFIRTGSIYFFEMQGFQL